MGVSNLSVHVLCVCVWVCVCGLRIWNNFAYEGINGFIPCNHDNIVRDATIV